MDSGALLHMLALGNLVLAGVLWCHAAGRRGRGDLSPVLAARLCQGTAWLVPAWLGPLNDITGAVFFILLSAGIAFEVGAFRQLAGARIASRMLLQVFAVGALLVALAALVARSVALPVQPGMLLVALFVVAGAAALGRGWRSASLLRRAMAAVNVLPVLAVAAGIMVRSGAGQELLAGRLGWARPYVDGAVIEQWALLAFLLTLLVNAAGTLLLGRDGLQSEMERLQVVDTLTDVPNRRGFYQGLAPWLALARRPGQPTALVILNLDSFKRVNDHYGHGVGDVVLKAIVDAVRGQLRDSDLMGRLGGAEFALLLPRTGLPEAVVVAERIRQAVAALPVKAERAVINLTASMGVTTIRAEDSTVSLFKRADEALQAAKLRGRNQVVAAAAPVLPDDDADLAPAADGPAAASTAVAATPAAPAAPATPGQHG